MRVAAPIPTRDRGRQRQRAQQSRSVTVASPLDVWIDWASYLDRCRYRGLLAGRWCRGDSTEADRLA